MVRQIDLATVYSTTSLWLGMAVVAPTVLALCHFICTFFAPTPKGRAAWKVRHTLTTVLVRQFPRQLSLTVTSVVKETFRNTLLEGQLANQNYM
mmetsp:Transcript_41910/g.111612  ORF Transcript_41910/g.111612 Transcript_41910/m.111612 type:complete len:94 (+) Transcript_41910:469-750(+)